MTDKTHNKDLQDEIIVRLQEILQQPIQSINTLPQGMSSSVFLITTRDEQAYVVKYGMDVARDVPVLKKIVESNIAIPIPRLITSFVINDISVVVFDYIRYPLLESVAHKDIPRYIPSMIEIMKSLHTITMKKHGDISGQEKTTSWRDWLLSIFDGRKFDWDTIAKRKGLNGDLLIHSVDTVITQIKEISLPEAPYSLLHTDFNQRNLFVNLENDTIAGVIDWEEAVFGDPLFDFARIRMLLWHFNASEEDISTYYSLMCYTNDEKKREDLYWLIRIIQYLAWYSEELTPFNKKRITLHEKYLKKWLH